LRGAGRDVSRLVVAGGIGNYVAVIGATEDADGVGRWSMSKLTIDQNAAAGNLLDIPLATTYPRAALRLGDYARGSSIRVVDCAITDSDSLNAMYLFAAFVLVADNAFTRVGSPPGTTVHDHSTIYAVATADDARVTVQHNTFAGLLSSGGARTAIETHGGVQLVANNDITGYLAGMNLTSIADSTTPRVTALDNRIEQAAIGIQLWTSVVGAQGRPRELPRVELVGNAISLDGAAWRLPGLDIPTSGILLNPTNGAEIGELSILSNRLSYLVPVTPSGSSVYSAAISCRTGMADARPQKLRIEHNLLRSAPTSIDPSCLGDGAAVTGNEVVP